MQIADEIRAETPKALEAFRRMGIEVHVLSGDQPPAVAAVAEQLGMSQSQVHNVNVLPYRWKIHQCLRERILQ